MAASVFAAIVSSLETLQNYGPERIVMTSDGYNQEWRDAQVAYDVATKALEWARDAVMWMTIPELPGD